MPGPPRWRTPILIQHCLSAQKIFARTIDTRVENMLKFIQKVARHNPDLVYGDGKERVRDSQDSRSFCRKLASEGMVLLKNENNLLPFEPTKAKKIAVIGPSAKGKVISGGGSAALEASYVVTPWDGLLVNKPAGIQVEYAMGCECT